MLISNAVPRLRWSFAGLLTWRYGIDPRSVHVGFEVDKVALGQVFLPVLRLSPVIITLPTLHTHSHPYVAITRRTNGRRTGKIPKSSSLSEMGGTWIKKCFHLVSSGLNVEPNVLKCVITEPHRFNTRVGYLTTMWCYWGHLTSRRRTERQEYLRKILHRRV